MNRWVEIVPLTELDMFMWECRYQAKWYVAISYSIIRFSTRRLLSCIDTLYAAEYIDDFEYAVAETNLYSDMNGLMSRQRCSRSKLTHTHTNVTHVRTYIHACMHSFIHSFIHSNKCTYVHIYISYVYSYIITCILTYIQTHIQTLHTYVHTDIHKYVRTYLWQLCKLEGGTCIVPPLH